MAVVRRSIAVPLLLDGNSLVDFLELERAYRLAKQAVLDYLAGKYKGRVSYFKVWYEVKELAKRYSLPFAYKQQAVKEAVETFNTWVETGGRKSVVRKAAPYVDERAWRMDSLTAISIRLMNDRIVVDLWPHRRFWRFEWLVMTGRAKQANTIHLKRIRDEVYAVFTYEVEAEAEKRPPAVAAFDVNENTVVAARIDLKETVDKVAQWNRGNPSDFTLHL